MVLYGGEEVQGIRMSDFKTHHNSEIINVVNQPKFYNQNQLVHLSAYYACCWGALQYQMRV